MVSSEYKKLIAEGYLFLANMLNAMKIDRLVVPEVVQTGASAVLECQFSAEEFTLQWWLNADSGGHELVYEWTPRSPPEASGAFAGRLDSSFKVSLLPTEEYRAIRILRVDPQLSGEYTCVVITNDGAQTRQSKRMLVFSPEEEFELAIKSNTSLHTVEMTCYAHGVYPQPDLVLEFNKVVVSQQEQRVWRRNNLLYEAESKARLRAPCGNHLEVTCRLFLPHADYTAITKRFITFGERCNRGWKNDSASFLSILLLCQFLGFFTSLFCSV